MRKGHRGGTNYLVEMKEELNESGLNRILADLVTKRHIYGAVFYVSSDDGSIDLEGASGDFKRDSRYYIASVNKLLVSAVTLRLCSEGKLDLRDKISEYLSGEVIRGLHLHRGKDYSSSITIAHLMSHTSGLPCYLTDRQANGRRVMSELEAGIDQAWPIERVVQETKRMKTHFPPGKEGKARYSDTNYRILGSVLESITGDPVNVVLKNLFQELSMSETHVCEDLDDTNFVPIRYKSEAIQIPLYLTSTQDDVISTAVDQMKFLKSFFNGVFFPKERLHELEKWNNVFFPFSYGIGLQKFSLPRVLSPLHPVPDMVGHCGSTGSVAFYVPDRGIYLTGSLNQQARPNVAFQTMIRIVGKIGHK